MRGKILLALVIAALAAEGVAAQTDFRSMPKNTLTVDLGPTIVGASMGLLGDMAAESADEFNSSGFGIGAQYERQLFEKISVGARFAFLKFGIGVQGEAEGGETADFDLDFTSFSVEAHVRFYPFGQTFFLDGMGGYGHISMPMSAEATFTDNGYPQKESVSFSAERHYIKYGGKLGWRIDFGRPGGFVFEPSLGYYGSVGLGASLWDEFVDSVESEGGVLEGDDGSVEDALALLEKYIFIGGPRVSLSVGWRF